MTSREADEGWGSRGYDALVEECAASSPLVGAILRQTQKNRSERLRFWLTSGRVIGLDEFLGYIGMLVALYRQDETLRTIAFLVTRARNDFDVAIEGTFAGMHSVVSEAMRDVMEIEFLLRDFLHIPSNLTEWLTADDKTRRTNFKPYDLRQREAKRLGMDVKALPDSTDYQAHSMALHVTPVISAFENLGVVKGVMAGGDPFYAETCFVDIFVHAYRIAVTGYHLGKQTAPQLDFGHEPEVCLPRFMTAFRHTQETLHMAVESWPRAELDALIAEVVAARIEGRHSQDDREREERLLSWVMREEVYAQIMSEVGSKDLKRITDPLEGLRVRLLRSLVDVGRRHVQDAEGELAKKQEVLSIILILNRPDHFLPIVNQNTEPRRQTDTASQTDHEKSR